MTAETVSHPPFLECSANCETILVTASPTAKDIGPLAQTQGADTFLLPFNCSIHNLLQFFFVT